MKALVATFFRGLSVVLPVALTVWLVVWLATSAERLMRDVLQWFLPQEVYVPGLGVLLGIVFIFLMGLLVQVFLLRQLWEWLESQFERIPGVKTVYNVRDISAHYAMLRDEKAHQVARAGWIGDYSDPQNFLFLNRADNPGFNYGNYMNEEYDGLLDKAADTVDLEERAKILAEAEALFLRDVPQIPLLFYSSMNLVSPKLQGWEPNIQDVHGSRFISIAE